MFPPVRPLAPNEWKALWSRVIFEKYQYQKSRVPWPLAKIFSAAWQSFWRHSKSRGGLGFPKGVREKHVTASGKLE